MKNIFKTALCGLVLLATMLGSTSCAKEEGGPTVNKPAVDTFSPMPNEAGTVKVYEGDEVTLTGFNLDNVTSVLLGTTECEITVQEIKEIVFKVPAFQLAQQDAPHAMLLYVKAGEETVYTNNFFVTIPVSDAIVSGFAPAEGATVGGEVTLTGRNLDKLTSVKFAGTSIPAANFVSQAAAEVKFAVPAGTYPAGTSDAAILAYWGDNNTEITVTSEFKVLIPDASAPAQAPSVYAAIGDEVEFTGVNLDLIDEVFIGTYKLTVIGQTPTTLTVKFPNSIEEQTPPRVTWDITSTYGAPAQTATIFTGFRLDTTPTTVPVDPPTMSSIAVEDGAADKAYLRKEVTVTGTYLLNVDKIEVGGIEAAVKPGATNTELVFTVPETFAFDTATEVEVKAFYDSSSQDVSFGNLTVYPFYYWPNITIGAQDDANKAIAFFVPDTGEVLSTDQWSALDPPAAAGNSNTVQNQINKTNLSSAQYYSVPAYVFATVGSNSMFTIIGPVNSSSQLKNFKTSGGAAITGTQFGTPLMGYRNLDFTASGGGTASEKAYADAVRDGSLSAISVGNLPDKRASSGAPGYNTTGAENNRFTIGNVLLVQHVNYTRDDAGFSGFTEAQIYKSGYMHIKSITDTSAGTSTKASTLTFDFYWSRVINE